MLDSAEEATEIETGLGEFNKQVQIINSQMNEQGKKDKSKGEPE